MALFDNFETIYRQFLASASGLNPKFIRKSNQDAPNGIYTYISYQIINKKNVSAFDVEDRKIDGTMDITPVREITVQVDVYGVDFNVHDLADSIQMKAQNQENTIIFNENNIGLIDEGENRDLSFLESDEWIQRANLRQVFLVELPTQNIDVGWFNTVDIEGTFNPDDIPNSTGRPIIDIQINRN